MKTGVRITTLIEDSVHVPALSAELGLSFHIQFGEHSVLFDTGQTGLVVKNARQLGIELKKVEAIALSHGHYDHTGGLEAVLASACGAKVFLHPSAWERKFSLGPLGKVREIGMPAASAKAIREVGGDVIETTTVTEIVPGLFLTGAVPRVTEFETTGGDFYCDCSCSTRDSLPDDQALFFNSPDGVVVVLGCAHSGAVNTLEHVRKLTGNRPIHSVIGGMHLLKGEKTGIESMLERLRCFEIQKVAPGHCTGLLATAMIWSAYAGRAGACNVGTVMEYQAR